MATKTGICNIALRSLGAGRITSIDQAVEQARILTDIYTDMLKEVLAAHPWNFAKKRDTLTELATAPEFGYDHAYQLPGDCLRVVQMADDDSVFVVESDQLFTDESSAKIEYIAYIEDTSKYSPGFVAAFAARLAAEIALPITDSRTKAADMLEVYKEKLTLAKSADAQEGTAKVHEESSWIDDRE